MNIVKAIYNGIKSFINKPVEAVQKMVTKIRNFLPFSPAKIGPLKDIHKIKLVETIAASINSKPLINAMSRTMGDVAGFNGRAMRPIGAMGGGGIVLNSTINVTGGNKAEFQKALEIRDRDLLRMVEEAIRRKAVRSFDGKWNPLG